MTKSRIAGPDDGLLSTRSVDDVDWHELAPAAGGIGRFVMDLKTGMCALDAMARRTADLRTQPDTFPSAVFFDQIHPEDRAEVAGALEGLEVPGDDYEAEFRIRRGPDEWAWLRASGRRIRTADGRDLLIGVNHDVTERRMAEDRAELLAGEMAHRIKNVFTMVQSMFNMAARSAPTRETLIASYSGRLHALAEVNALTFSGEDHRVALDDMVRTILGPLIDANQVKVDLEPGFALNGTAAQTVVLGLNELTTNAVKHGALSAEGGRIDLSILVRNGDFILTWKEHVPFTLPPMDGKVGFGMRVLKSMTAATFGGSPQFDWRPEGLIFSCTWKAQDMSWQSDAAYAGRTVDQAVGEMSAS